MDDLRGSFSRLKKDIKHRFKKSGQKVDKPGVDGHGERVASSGSLPRPDPRVLTGGGREREGDGPNADDEGVGPSAAADNSRSEWKSTASASAKLLLRGVRDSADAFGPLKSIAGGLCFILESCEKTKANKQGIELLAPRVKELAERLCHPVAEGDTKERTRRKRLEWKLQDVLQDLALLQEQGKVEGFFRNAENASRLGGLVDEIRDTMMEYQTSLQQDIYDKQQDIYEKSCILVESADLVLLARIHHTVNAGHRSGNRQGCLRGTRKDVLRDVDNWLTSERGQRIFWLNGLAGTGKSTIAQTFAETTLADGKLGASFFCSRDFEDRSNLQMIFPTLAFQLSCQYPRFQKKLLEVLKECPDVGHESLCSQMEKLIVGPLKATGIPTLIIIDALDECKDEESASAILSILSRYVDQIPNVKFFITGRPEPRIRSGFRLESLAPITGILKLHEVKPEVVDRDIELFFQTQLTSLARNRSDLDLTEDWPSSSDIRILCKKAAGFFIYAATVVKFIDSKTDPPTKRLSLITLSQSDGKGECGVDQLYTEVLQQAFHTVYVDISQGYLRFRTVVGAISLIFNPLSIKGISDLLGCDRNDTQNTIRSLHSLLLVPDTIEDPIQIFHKSFPDFLMDPDRCKDKQFFVEPTTHHEEILLGCLRVMGEGLKKNICNLNDHAILSEVEDISTRKKDYIGDALEYACRFWTKHLLCVPNSSPHAEGVQEAIEKFFTVHFLHWIEVLALTGDLGFGVYAMDDIEQWYNLAGIVSKWTNDSQRFLLEHFDTINNSPSNIYYSALPFSPSSSWFHKCYSAELLPMVKVVKGLLAEWGTCSRMVLLDSMTPALSCWNNNIAVGSKPGDIIILNAITGSQTSVLFGHTKEVNSLNFLSDGTSLVSGSDDCTVKLWDMQTGGVVKTFSGHTNWVYSVSVSADCATIASGSSDDTIRLWDIQTGKCYHVIRQQSVVRNVRFSPIDPQHLISICGSRVWQWDINGHQIKPLYDGSYIAFSSDGTLFVLCHKETVTVHNTSSGVTVAEIYMANNNTHYCCFSPESRLVAVAAGSTIYIWDITSSDPHLIETLIGHTNKITSLAFSSPSTLISASGDRSVRFWQIKTPSTDPAITDPKSAPLTSPIKSITLQTKDGIAVTTDSDGVVRTWDISTGLYRASFQTLATASHKRDVQLINGRLIFVWHADRKIHVWDTEKEKLLLEVDSSWPDVEDLRISGDGSRVFCLGAHSIYAWSIQTGEVVGKATIEYSKFPGSLIVDGSKVWAYWPQSKYQGWDFGTPGSSPVQLSNIPTLLPNGSMLWDVSQTRIRSAITGVIVFQLPSRFAKPVSVQCDGYYLVAGYESGEVLILDLNHVLLQ